MKKGGPETPEKGTLLLLHTVKNDQFIQSGLASYFTCCRANSLRLEDSTSWVPKIRLKMTFSHV